MPRYVVTLTEEEEKELKTLVQKGGKGYRIKHAQILLKLDKRPENEEWTYDRIKEAYGASHSTIAGVAKRFVMEGLEAALGRKEQKNCRRKVTGEVEAQICLIVCSDPPDGASRWTMQTIADELIRMEVGDYITDSTVCEVMKKRNQAVAGQRMVHPQGRCGICSENGGCAHDFNLFKGSKLHICPTVELLADKGYWGILCFAQEQHSSCQSF